MSYTEHTGPHFPTGWVRAIDAATVPLVAVPAAVTQWFVPVVARRRRRTSRVVLAFAVVATAAGVAAGLMQMPVQAYATRPFGPRAPGVDAAAPLPTTTPEPTLATSPPCPTAPAGPRFHTSGAGKRVALTFDDGPGPDTHAVLDILAGEGVHATFFVLGSQALTHPAEVARIVGEGNAIGNHSWDHPQLPTLDASTQARQLDETRRVVEGMTGQSLCLFRPPYGEHDATTDGLAVDRGLQTVLWSVDTEDWKLAPGGLAALPERVLARAEAGSAQTSPIVLFHDGGGNRSATVTSLPAVIAHYRGLGYEFTRVDGTGF